MRILYVSHLFLPRFSGGTEVLTFQVAREMQRRGHEAEVLACEDWRGPAPDAGQGIAHEMNPVRRAYLFVIDGALTLNGSPLAAGDQARVTDEPRLELEAPQPAELLLLDLP